MAGIAQNWLEHSEVWFHRTKMSAESEPDRCTSVSRVAPPQMHVQVHGLRYYWIDTLFVVCVIILVDMYNID